jgi:very-short-patch-repair endonuclease
MGTLAHRFTARARHLRANSTDAEGKLWSLLRSRGLAGHKFVGQLPVSPYFADFACRELALIVEADGSQHAGSLYDEARTRYLNAEGYSVLRFWNNEVLENPKGVHTAITLTIAGNPSPDWRFAPADLSPEGRGVRGRTASHNAQLRARSPLPSGERSPRSGG